MLCSLILHTITFKKGIRTRLYTNIYTLKLKNLHRDVTYKYGLHNKILTQFSTIQFTRLATMQQYTAVFLSKNDGIQ